MVQGMEGFREGAAGSMQHVQVPDARCLHDKTAKRGVGKVCWVAHNILSHTVQVATHQRTFEGMARAGATSELGNCILAYRAAFACALCTSLVPLESKDGGGLYPTRAKVELGHVGCSYAATL